MNQQKIFQAYSDESGINDEDRYTSVSVVSGEAETLGRLRDKLAKEINDKRIKEVKFVKMTSYRSTITQAAKGFIVSSVNDYAALNKIRIDTITVDNQYLLSKFPAYNRGQKLEHMYYCVIAHIVRQWNNMTWSLYPDENSKINWSKINDYLNNTRLHKKQILNPLLMQLMLDENPSFIFDEIEPLPSINEPLIQIADLFAGMARFSHEEKVDCTKWVINQKNGWQPKMQLGEANKTSGISQTKVCRYQIIGEVCSLCSKHRLGVSIKTKKHLNTWRPKNPINFWDYKRK